MIPDFLCQECLFMAPNFPLELSGCSSSATSPPEPQSQNHCSPSHTVKPSGRQYFTLFLWLPHRVFTMKSKLSFQIPASLAVLRVREWVYWQLWAPHSPYNTLQTQAAKPRLSGPCYNQRRNLWNVLALTRSLTFSWGSLSYFCLMIST